METAQRRKIASATLIKTNKVFASFD